MNDERNCTPMTVEKAPDGSVSYRLDGHEVLSIKLLKTPWWTRFCNWFGMLKDDLADTA